MPLTPFQRAILTVLAATRSPESHFAGGIILHAADDSARYSRDFDIFHDVAAEVTRASEQDVAALRTAGFSVETLSRTGEWQRETTFRRARVIDRPEAPETIVEIDWAADSAFRFFPIESDAQLGWRLHRFDLATNKALTLAARTETRDYVDIVEISESFPLAAICWAACGKDPGFTPLSLLAMMRRFARVDPIELDKIRARAIDPVALKARWTTLADAAQEQMTALADSRPEIPIGVAFVDEAGQPEWVGDNPAPRIHAPSIRGCWPTVRAAGIE